MDRQRRRGITAALATACLPMLVLAHEVVGRLRFASPRLKGDGHEAGRLVRQVRAVAGVTDVQVRRSTGSLIVLYDRAHATRQAILKTLRVAPPANEARRQPLLDEFVEAAAQHLLNIAAQGVIAALR